MGKLRLGSGAGREAFLAPTEILTLKLPRPQRLKKAASRYRFGVSLRRITSGLPTIQNPERPASGLPAAF